MPGDLDFRQALVEVTLKTPRPGRMPDGGYFDYDAVVFGWKRGQD